MTNFSFDQVKEKVFSGAPIVITTHHNPDGDAIGSSLALFNFLQARGLKVSIIVPNDYPGFLKWLTGTSQVIIFNQQKEKAEKLIAEAGIIFCLDYNAIHRAGQMEEPINKATGIKILIDHHLEPASADFNMYFSVVKTSSTSELIWQLLEGIGATSEIDKDIAECLFVGIMTDTGSFSYACNFRDTFEITGQLIAKGVNAEHCHRMVYDTYSESRLRLLGYCLSEKLIILPEFSTAYIALSIKELERFNYKIGDTEGVVNYALSIQGIKLAALLTERKDRIRLSFRSKGDLSANKIAREYFAGGGHLNAAGGDSFMSLEKTVAKLLEVLAQYKKEIDRSSY